MNTPVVFIGGRDITPLEEELIGEVPALVEPFDVSVAFPPVLAITVLMVPVEVSSDVFGVLIIAPVR